MMNTPETPKPPVTSGSPVTVEDALKRAMDLSGIWREETKARRFCTKTKKKDGAIAHIYHENLRN